MVEVVLTGLGKIADYLVAPIGRQFTYLFCFNSNIKELEAKFEELQATRQGVQMVVDRDERNVRVIAPNVEVWLKSASEVTTEVEGIIQDKAKVKEGCLNGWCPNLKLRYSLSRKAVKKTPVVVDLRKDGIQYTQSSYSPPPTCLETITNRDFTGFESRRLNMEEIFKALKHDDINLIGVCGMGGVGKTTMVYEVAKRAKEDNHFDEVAMAVVGQKPNLDNVQACIADILGLKKLRDTKSPIERADLLRRRLLQNNKKILVILDDVWAEINLEEDMGFPLRGTNKNFKMLYTSRIRDLWHDVRTKKETPLELLSEDEAWQLFREKAGDSADAQDLRPIAKQIVRECGCLPLALVLIGRALSKKSGRNAVKDIWEGMLDQLTCASSTPADNQLSSRLELSYEYLEDKEAQHLFLLCCFFQDDEDIRIEDLARYGCGLSLFDRINDMAKVRRRVLLIVDDLKSRYLLLQSSNEKCVKVHDVVRDVGISIASKDKCAIVSHGAVSEWPKTVTHENERYIAISVISETIKELPEGLAYPNLEFLMLRCNKLEKLPPNFFEGIGKLKVLELKNFHGILTFQPLKNLTTLALEGFCGTLDNVRVIGDLRNLEILSFCDSDIKELPEEIGGLVNLRLLDLSVTRSLNRIPPGVISRLVRLEELYCMGSKFSGWEGEGKEQGGRNPNLREFESLSNLNTLRIQIRKDVFIPEPPIFRKLKNYRVAILDKDDDIFYDMDDIDFDTDDVNVSFKGLKRILVGHASIPMIDLLARSSDGLLLLGREGCNDLLREVLFRDGVDGIQQLKVLLIGGYDNLKCLVDTLNRVHLPTAILRSEEKKPTATAPPTSAFPILQILGLGRLPNLREICRGPVPAGSFGELTSIRVEDCGRLGNLFQLRVVGCLTQLKRLSIKDNDMMKEVFQKEQQGDVRDITNRIVFPKLEFLELAKLPSLVGFCRGIDLIDFPQLKELRLRHMPQFNLLFHNNSNLSSNSEQGFLSLFPHKVSLPNLEVIELTNLENLERLGHGSFSVGSLPKLKEFSVSDCGKLLCVFASQLLPMLRNLENLTVESCNLLEVVFELEGADSSEPNPMILSPLKRVELRFLPKLNYISKRDPMVFKYIQTLDISDCNSLRHVFAPTMAKSIPLLCNLSIRRCEMLLGIVAEENGLGESSVDEVEFPQLESLDLCDLPNLVSFFPNVNTTVAKSSDYYHNPVQPWPLFNEKVAIPSLEYLRLSGLKNVRNMFHPFMAGGLVNLQKLFINDCSTLEVVVGKEEEVGGHGRKIDKTLFPQLIELKLGSLPKLKMFCHFTHPLEIPLLRAMGILDCPSMDAFSLGHVSAPNLSLPGILWNGDLNNAMQKMKLSMVFKKWNVLGEVDEEVGGSEKHEDTEL